MEPARAAAARPATRCRPAEPYIVNSISDGSTQPQRRRHRATGDAGVGEGEAPQVGLAVMRPVNARDGPERGVEQVDDVRADVE